MSVVRENLLTREGYTPYCGAEDCRYRMPRTGFDGEQFKCPCGWRSSFEQEFISSFKLRWRFDQIRFAVGAPVCR